MSKSLYAPTEDFIKIERTELDADSLAGSSVSLTLKDNNGFSDNDFVVIGREGAEQAELAQINAAVTAGQTIQVDTLKFTHKKGTPVTKYRYNNRKFYGCATAMGSFAELTAYGSPVTIQVDDPQGTLLEYTGVEGYLYFKATYYNSETTAESAIADSEAVLADESARYTSLYKIRVQAGLVGNSFISDDRIETKRKQAENEVNSAIFARYVLPLTEVPPLIELITTLLAAGYIDFEEYGPEGEGVKWLGEARGILKALQKGTQRLIGASSIELPVNATTNVLTGYPNSDGTDDDDDDGAQFKMSDKF
jgi:hypothetical protein